MDLPAGPGATTPLRPVPAARSSLRASAARNRRLGRRAGRAPPRRGPSSRLRGLGARRSSGARARRRVGRRGARLPSSWLGRPTRAAPSLRPGDVHDGALSGDRAAHRRGGDQSAHHPRSWPWPTRGSPARRSSWTTIPGPSGPWVTGWARSSNRSIASWPGGLPGAWSPTPAGWIWSTRGEGAGSFSTSRREPWSRRPTRPAATPPRSFSCPLSLETNRWPK